MSQEPEYPGGVMHPSARRFLVILYVTYFLLALLFNLFTPIGEASDELAHFDNIRIVYNEKQLPSARNGLWEGHQGPIYYFAQASWAYLMQLIIGCGVSPDRIPFRLNPCIPKGTDFNFLIHGSTERLSNWTCTEFSFHLQLVSCLRNPLNEWRHSGPLRVSF